MACEGSSGTRRAFGSTSPAGVVAIKPSSMVAFKAARLPFVQFVSHSRVAFTTSPSGIATLEKPLVRARKQIRKVVEVIRRIIFGLLIYFTFKSGVACYVDTEPRRLVPHFANFLDEFPCREY